MNCTIRRMRRQNSASAKLFQKSIECLLQIHTLTLRVRHKNCSILSYTGMGWNRLQSKKGSSITSDCWFSCSAQVKCSVLLLKPQGQTRFSTDFWHLQQFYFLSGYIMLFVCAGLLGHLAILLLQLFQSEDILQTHTNTHINRQTRTNFYEKGGFFFALATQKFQTICSSFSDRADTWHLKFQINSTFGNDELCTGGTAYDEPLRVQCVSRHSGQMSLGVTWNNFLLAQASAALSA